MAELDAPAELRFLEINANGTERTTSVLGFRYKVNDQAQWQNGQEFAVQNGDLFSLSFSGLVRGAEHLIKIVCGKSSQSFSVHYRTDLATQANNASVDYYEATFDEIIAGKPSVNDAYTEEWLPAGAARGAISIERAFGYEQTNGGLMSAADEGADRNGYSLGGSSIIELTSQHRLIMPR